MCCRMENAGPIDYTRIRPVAICMHVSFRVTDEPYCDEKYVLKFDR